MKIEIDPSFLKRRDFIRQAACAAVGTVAVRNTLRDLHLINAVMAQTGISDYKALVCVFMNGGNDANNLIIPTGTSDYTNYATLRTPILALPKPDGTGATALALNPLNNDGHTYAIHPACPGLRQLFNEGKSAALFNVGTLVYPMTKTQYFANTVAKPPQLFSHSDQQTQWQTSIPDRPPASGWGGRVADILNSVNAGGQVNLAISLAGTNTWERGDVVQQYSVSTTGAIALSDPTTARKTALLNVLGVPQSNLQVQEYATALSHSVNESGILNNSIANNSTTFDAVTFSPADPYLGAGPVALFPTTITTPNNGATFTSSLSSQLKMVARLIEAGHRAYTGNVAGTGLGMKRQIFFVQVGGYDTHTNQTDVLNNGPVVTGSQANLLAELSRCLYGFQRAMEKLSLGNKVTAFTMSDFARTFPSNGQGSDHGWGSHHIVVGSAVAGQKTYGKFPTQIVNGPDDTGTGRWLPTMAVDQYSATLATWFGVDPGNLSTVFPNIARFATPPPFMNAS